jgi:hypothetical protein
MMSSHLVIAQKNKHTRIKSNAIAVCLYGYFVDVGGLTNLSPFKIKKASIGSTRFLITRR